MRAAGEEGELIQADPGWVSIMQIPQPPLCIPAVPGIVGGEEEITGNLAPEKSQLY